MSTYVKIENNIVTQSISAEPSFFNDFVDSSPGLWIVTEVGGLGDIYEVSTGTFCNTKPYPSWVRKSNTKGWDAPVTYPTDSNMYSWNEETLSWAESSTP